MAIGAIKFVDSSCLVPKSKLTQDCCKVQLADVVCHFEIIAIILFDVALCEERMLCWGGLGSISGYCLF